LVDVTQLSVAKLGRPNFATRDLSLVAEKRL